MTKDGVGGCGQAALSALWLSPWPLGLRAGIAFEHQK